MKHIRGIKLFLLLFVISLGLAIAPVSLGQQAAPFSLRVIHTNDHHAHIDPVKAGDRTLGGVARRATLIKQIRAENAVSKQPLLLLDAGDIFQGTLYFNEYLGMADLDFYNAMGYDASAIGNHEFDRGQEPLVNFIKAANFPMIAANIQLEASSPLAGTIRPWIIKEFNGEKIGLFGLTTTDTPNVSSPGAGISFIDSITTAKQSVQELTNLGVNKIIALTHVGFNVDQELAKQVDGIDLIIGGHSHTPVGNIPGTVAPYPLVMKTPNGDPVLVTTDWEWGKFLGDTNLVFDPRGKLLSWAGKPIPVEDPVIPDPETVAKIAKYAEPLQASLRKIVGKTTVSLLRGDRKVESNLGNLVADAMLLKTRSLNPQIALMNTGGLRTDIPAGDISAGQVQENMPFGNTVTVADLTGDQVKAALENSVSQVESGGGRFSQVAGLRFIWDPSKPAGSRIVDIQVKDGSGNFRAMDTTASYRVIANSFIQDGGDGYTVFTQAQNRRDTGFILTEALQEYLAANSPVSPKIEGRILQGSQPFTGS